MTALKHFVTWKISLKEFEEILESLKECPVVSLPIGDGVELTIIKREAQP